jgi:SRSO17 transposase
MCWRWPATTRSWSAGLPSAPTSCASGSPPRAWQRVSAGQGAKGHRFYDWAFVQLDPGDHDADDPGQRWLLRRNRTSGELAYYRCFMAHSVPLATLVKVAGRRWSIEMCQPQCTHIRELAA